MDKIVDEEGIEWVKFNESNPHILINDDKDFKCVTCNQVLKNKIGAQTHSTRKHKIRLDGTQLEEQTESDLISSPDIQEDIESLVMRIQTTDDAKSASKIVKDIELMHLYYGMKARHMIHPDWNLHDFLRESAYFYADQYGIQTTFSQDVSLLDEGKRKNIQFIQEKWSEEE